MLSFLAQDFKEEYIEVAKSNKLAVGGVLDAASLAAIQHDARLKDWQTIRILKHISFGLGCNVSVGYHKIKLFSDGVIHPKG